ncbi:MAG: hypothetical protein JSS89_12150 [Bacteroidetes bacterium]|nr:hypothetical protein [Bacteroidota bacterium]
MSLFNAAVGRKRSLADSEIDISIKTNGPTANNARKSKKKSGKKSSSSHGTKNARTTVAKSAKKSTKKSAPLKSPKAASRTKADCEPVKKTKHTATSTRKHTSVSSHSGASSHSSTLRRSTPSPAVRSGSLFRVNRAPLSSYGRRTFLSDSSSVADSTNINEPLADRTPTAQEIEFVKTLNRKFKRLEDKLQSQFRAYCGGSAGFVVRRYTLSCATPNEDILSTHKPIGMGPKGLDKYFMKHYKISWDYFLKTPSEVLELKLVKGEAAPPSKRTRKRSAAAAAKKTKKSEGVRAKKRTPMTVVPSEVQSQKSPAQAKRTTAPRTPVRSKRAKAATAPTIDYDRTEREMNELKQLLQQSIK